MNGCFCGSKSLADRRGSAPRLGQGRHPGWGNGRNRRFLGQLTVPFPRCLPGSESVIAEHACLKYSGRVGRSAAAKSYDADVIRLAVVAHLRHTETQYDRLLGRGCERREARQCVEAEVARVPSKWQALG
jgi:hypothetical protein